MPAIVLAVQNLEERNMGSNVKLILACDMSDIRAGVSVIDKTAAEVDIVKIGLEAMTAEDVDGKTLARIFRHRALNVHDQDVMWDMKIHDVANTMSNATRNIVRYGSQLFTLHATASDQALSAVAKAVEGTNVMPLAVTVLTDLDEPQCQSRFACSPKSAVVEFARNAWFCGIRGFVCSALEAAAIRDALPNAYIVTPGIRPLWAVKPDEQKRVTTPTQAKQAGVNAIVVGRPIYNPPLSHTEADAAHDIRMELDAA